MYIAWRSPIEVALENSTCSETLFVAWQTKRQNVYFVGVKGEEVTNQITSLPLKHDRHASANTNSIEGTATNSGLGIVQINLNSYCQTEEITMEKESAMDDIDVKSLHCKVNSVVLIEFRANKIWMEN